MVDVGNQIHTRARAGSQIGAIIRTLSGINTLTNWLERGVRVVSTTQQLDFAGATGKLIASVLFAVAEMEQETRRERQAAGIEAAKAAGIYKGRKPGSTKADVGKMAELRAKGRTDAEIAAIVGTSRQTVWRCLRSHEQPR